MVDLSESQIWGIKQISPKEAIARFLDADTQANLSRVDDAILPLELPKYRDKFLETEAGRLWYEAYVGEREQVSSTKQHHTTALEFKLESNYRGGIGN